MIKNIINFFFKRECKFNVGDHVKVKNSSGLSDMKVIAYQPNGWDFSVKVRNLSNDFTHWVLASEIEFIEEIKQENVLASLDKIRVELDLYLVSNFVDKLIDIINDDDFEKERAIQHLENLKKYFEKIGK